MGNLVEQLTTNFVVGGLALFAISLGFFSVHYLNRRRQLLHQERMAAVIKSLHYAGVARDVFKPKQPESRQHLLSGLRWLFGAAGVSSALYGYENLQPVADAGTAVSAALVGLIPGFIGLAHLLFSFFCSRRSITSPMAAAPGSVYRVAGRRF